MIMKLHSAIDDLDGRAPRSQLITYAAPTMATSTTAKDFVSSASPVSRPVHPAVRAEVSPVRMWATATVTSAPNRTSRLSLLTLEPMWTSCGTAKGVSAATVAARGDGCSRRVAAYASSGSGATIATLIIRSRPMVTSQRRVSPPPGNAARMVAFTQ